MVSKRRSAGASTGLDETVIPSYELTPISLENVAYGLLGRYPESNKDFDALGTRLAKAIKRRKAYDGYYVRSVWNGDNPMTGPLGKAVDNLMAELLAEPPNEEYRVVEVLVPRDVHLPDGTVILRDAVTCICGKSFVPTIWNQINHTRACAFMRLRMGTRTNSGT